MDAKFPIVVAAYREMPSTADLDEANRLCPYRVGDHLYVRSGITGAISVGRIERVILFATKSTNRIAAKYAMRMITEAGQWSKTTRYAFDHDVKSAWAGNRSWLNPIQIDRIEQLQAVTKATRRRARSRA